MRLFFVYLNGEWEIPGRQKVVRWSDVPVLTSHADLNPSSCTTLSLIDGRENRPRLVHASMARGITASFVSPYWLGYERKARVIKVLIHFNLF